VWGDAKERTPVQINNQTLRIGNNLRKALLNLRNLKDPRVLWVDAICINQEDDDERSAQVAIMGDIYRQAKRTVIWLRDHIEGTTVSTKKALSMLQDLADEAISLGQVDESAPIEKLQGPQPMVHLANFPVSKVGRSTLTSKLFDRYQYDVSVQHILECQWWYRAWITQEILLASDAVVVIGRYSISWDTICIGGNHGVNIGLWFAISFGAIHDPTITPYLSLQHMEMMCREHNSKENSARIMLELLIRCQFREATNPRDKIYSLLGLVANPRVNRGIMEAPSEEETKPYLPLGIWPDYKKSISTLYADVARQIMVETGSLDIIGACAAANPKYLTSLFPDFHPAAGPVLDRPLPLWVPDWNMTDTAVIPLLHDALNRSRTTHATAHSVVEPQFLDVDADGIALTLLLQAHEVTTLADLADPLIQLSIPVEMNSDGITPKTPQPGPKTLREKLDRLGNAFKSLSNIYQFFVSIAPHLAVFAEWEQFARKTRPANPVPPGPPTGTAVPEEEPEDILATFWQTLCVGTYPEAADAEAMAPGRGRKMAAQQAFCSVR
jgi:hypothetical protein